MPKTKPQVRKEIRELLAFKSTHDLQNESDKICSAFLQTSFYKESDAILSYMPMQREASPLAVTQAALKDGKLLALPRVVPNTSMMDFYLIKKDIPLQDQLTKGAWDIDEPSACCENIFPLIGKLKKMTVIVPGLAFTKDGQRLGHGKGFYDIYISRLLERAGQAGTRVTLAGLCFACQLVPSLPVEEHDIRMDLMLTSLL
ncbi:MAG: 5-formyltetrahydrofolate cyclo-ligase [Treponema sp.]|nr:5-formyltetrahydrofolate cyclo-ligase [Treponema sp.]